MRKSFLTPIVIIVCLIAFQPAQGQRLLKNIQQRIQQETEKKIEDKAVDKANSEIDKAINTAFENAENENDGEGTNPERVNANFLNSLGGEPIPVEDNYSFQEKIKMHVTNYSKSGKKESEGEFITLLSKNTQNMAYKMISGDMTQPGNGCIIIDATNNAMIILNEEDGEKSGLIYGFEAFMKSIGGADEDADKSYTENPESFISNPNVKKTGKSKKIAGYNCDQYLYEDEESESDIWITKDLKMEGKDIFSSLYKTSLYSSGVAWGYMMEATSTNKSDGKKTQMQVTEVDTKSKTTFSLSDYEITNLGNLAFPSGSGN